MQAEFVSEFFRKCREKKIHTTLDTSGYGKWEAFELILPFTELVLFDLKNMDAVKHVSTTGTDPLLSLNNFKRLAVTGVPIHVRSPVIPGYVDDEKSFRDLAEFAFQFDSVKKFEILPYHRLGEPKYLMLNRIYRLYGLEPPLPELMEKLNGVVRTIEREKRMTNRV